MAFDRNRRFNNRRGGGGFNRGRGGGRSFDRGPREMHKAICSECGKECEVPFKPTEGKPVFCRECFAKKRPRRFQLGSERLFFSLSVNYNDLKISLLLVFSEKMASSYSIFILKPDNREEIKKRKAVKAKKNSELEELMDIIEPIDGKQAVRDRMNIIPETTKALVPVSLYQGGLN